MTHYQRLNSDTLLRMTENQVFYSGFTTLLNFDKLLNVVTLRVMHIEKLLIQNFRGLQEIALNFPQNNLAVLIGTNGAGKSSILDCIAIMLAQFIARLRNSKKLEMRFTENDININSNFTANTITILAGQGERLSWKMTQERVYTQNKSNYDDINDYIKRLQETLKLQPNLNLPVMVYYQTHRMILKNRPDEVQQQINNCFQLIDDGQIELAKLALHKLSILLGENDTEVVRAYTLINFLED